MTIAPIHEFRAVVEIVHGDEPWWTVLRSNRKLLGQFLAQVMSIGSVSELHYSSALRKPRIEVHVTVRKGAVIDAIAGDLRANVRAIAQGLTSIVDTEPEADIRPTPMRPPPVPKELRR